MTYDEAVDWVKAKVDEMLGNTIYLSGASAKEGGAGIMEQDSLGASVSTRVSFENYQRVAHDAAPNIQMLGVQNLRVHKKQLDLKEIDDAYRAIKAEYDRQYQEGLVPELPELKKYNTIWNVEGNLGVSSIGYDFDKDRKLPVALIGPSLTETALVGAGLTKGKDFTELYLPHKRERTGYNFSLAAINRLVESGVLEDKKYAKLIDAITQVMPTWTRYRPDSASQKIEKQAGVAGVEQGFVDFGKKKLNWVWAASKGRIVISGKSYGLFERITFDEVKYSPSLREKWFEWNWDASTETVWFYVSEADKAANNVESRAPNFAKTLRESYKTWINFDPELPDTNTPEKGVFCCYGVGATYQWKDGFLIILGFWPIINPLRVDLERANIRVTFEKKTDKNTGKSVPLVYISKSDLLKVSSFTAGLRRLISTYLPIWDKGETTGIPGLVGDANEGKFLANNRVITYTWNKELFQIELLGFHLNQAARDQGAYTARDYTVIIPTSAIDRVSTVIEPKEVSRLLMMFGSQWAALKSSLDQTKDQGEAQGGSWKGFFPPPFLRLSIGVNGSDSDMGWIFGINGKDGKRLAQLKEGDFIVKKENVLEFLQEAVNAGHPEFKELEPIMRKVVVNPQTKRGTVGVLAWSFYVPVGKIHLTMASGELKALRAKIGGEWVKTLDGSGFSLEVSARNIAKAVDFIRPLHPRLAEALARAFGMAKQDIDQEQGCGHLEALSHAIGQDEDSRGAVQIDQIADSSARKEVETVEAELKKALPAGKTPRPFQTIGIAYAKMTDYRCLIADMPGLGKTIQAMGCIAIDPEKLLPALVVAPANVIYNWHKEIRSWLPHVQVMILEKIQTALPGKNYKGIVIVSWEIMRERRLDLLAWGFSLLVADEAHKAKNYATTTSQALRLLAVGTEGVETPGLVTEQPIPHVLLLTGTPQKNTVKEMHPLLSILNTSEWGDRKSFERQFSGETTVFDSDGKGHSRSVTRNVHQLRKKLACTMIRRFKEDALPDLPIKTRYMIKVPIPAAEVVNYYAAKIQFRTWLKKAIFEKLQKMGADPEQASEEALAAVEKALKAEILVRMGRLRELVAIYKIPLAVRIGLNLARSGESFLYFCDHQSVVQALSAALDKAGIKYGVIEGATPPERRSRLAVDFEEGKIQALVCTQAAKEGLTLVRAATSIFVERFWTPADEQQAEDRIHRIGQKRPVSIVFLQVANTIDDYMDALVEHKRIDINETIGDEDVEDAAVERSQIDLIKQMRESALGSIPEKMIDLLFERLPKVRPELQAWAEQQRNNLILMVYTAVQGKIPDNEKEVLDQIHRRLRTNPRPRGF